MYISEFNRALTEHALPEGRSLNSTPGTKIVGLAMLIGRLFGNQQESTSEIYVGAVERIRMSDVRWTE